LRLQRSGTVARSILVGAALLGSLTGTAAGGTRDHGPPEFILAHSNDLFAIVDDNDDRYTATMTLGARFRGWELELSENMFTDRKVNGIRFDETYLTLARDFTLGGQRWVLRAEAGVVDVGEGIYGESFQNWVHRLVNQDEYFLQYVQEDTHLFLGLRVSRPVTVGERVTLTPTVEHADAGFKHDSLVAIETDVDVARRFTLTGELGYRWSSTDFAPLDIFMQDDDPTFGVGASYKDWVDLRWTKNYFGTGSNHWHLQVRIPLKKNSNKAGVTD